MYEQAIERIDAALVSVFGGELGELDNGHVAQDETAADDEDLSRESGADSAAQENYVLVGLSTGVLVTLAGVEFVLTSAHGIWDKERRELRPAVEVYGGNRRVAFATRWGDRTVLRGFVPDRIVDGYPDPDVAVLELNPERLDRLRDSRHPYEEAEMRFLDPRSPARDLLLAGFVGTRIRQRTLLVSGDTLHEMTPRTHVLRSNPDGSHPRCIGVLVEPALAGLDGVSGGPLVVPMGRGLLVGLAFMETPDELLCEPVREAVRALRRHENPEVVKAANRVLACVTDLDNASSTEPQR